MTQKLLRLAHTGVDLLHQICSCLPPFPFLLLLVQFVPVASCAAKCTPQMRQASNTLQEQNSFITMETHNKLVYLLQTRQPLKMAVWVMHNNKESPNLSFNPIPLSLSSSPSISLITCVWYKPLKCSLHPIKFCQSLWGIRTQHYIEY